MYKVLKMFDDLMDCKTVKGGKIPYRYEEGDLYPRPGAKTSPARIAELAGSQNLRGTPLIAPIEPPVAAVEAHVEAFEDKVEEVPTEKVKKPRRRREADAKQD